MDNSEISIKNQQQLLLLINALALSYAFYKAFNFINEDLDYYYLRVLGVTLLNYFLIGLSLRKYRQPQGSFFYLSIVFFIYAIFKLIGSFSETEEKISIDKSDLFMSVIFTLFGFILYKINNKINK